MDFRPKASPSYLFRSWPATGLAQQIARVDRDRLYREHERLTAAAPRRRSRGKTFLGGRHGQLSMPGASNRFEERLAIALWRMWRTPASGPLRLLDYQVPLKARRSDRKIGKVDLLGVTDGGRLKVIELKVKRRGNRGDSPMFALMEGLRYAAIIEANREAIAEEARKYGEDISGERPIVQILAPRAWWRGWFELAGRTRRVVGAWEAEFAALAVDIEELLGILVECTALDDVEPTDIEMGADERQPQVDRMLALYPVLPGEAQPIGRPLGVPPAGS